MPARLLLLLILGLLALPGYSQEAVPGYIVTAGRDSIRGAVFPHDELTGQAGVDFVNLQGTQRQWLNATQLSAYGYTSKLDTIRYVAIGLNYPKAGAPRRVFVRQLVAGPVELLNYYYSTRLASSAAPSAAGTPVVRATAATAAHPSLYTAQYGGRPAGEPPFFPPLSATSARAGGGNSLLLRRRAQNSLTEITWWNFPVDAANYFADSPPLAAELREKRYRRRDIPQVVRRYNLLAVLAVPAR